MSDNFDKEIFIVAAAVEDMDANSSSKTGSLEK